MSGARAMSSSSGADTTCNTAPRKAGAAARMLCAGVRFYQAVFSPLLGGHCRFQPTCSHYAIEALTVHGAMRGGWMTLRRLLRCHPLGGAGFDPVPAAGEPSGSCDAGSEPERPSPREGPSADR